jgi:hypothetical protein
MGPPLAQPRCPAAGSLPSRHLHRRLPGGALRPSRSAFRQCSTRAVSFQGIRFPNLLDKDGESQSPDIAQLLFGQALS